MVVAIRRTWKRIVLALVCVMPVADLALSDATVLYVLRRADGWVGLASPLLHRIVIDGAIAVFIFAECFVLAWPVTRMRSLQGVFGDFESYQETRRAGMGPARRLVSAVLGAPYAALGALAARVERLGDRLSGSADASPVRRRLARLLVDLGQVNAIGTTAVAMQEAGSSSVPVTQRRIAVLAALIAASWIVVAELIRGLYAVAGLLGPPGAALNWCLDALGRAFDALTTVDLGSPSSTPVGTVFLGFVAVALFTTGWNLARFHEGRASAAA
jgi:hypothetical protein